MVDASIIYTIFDLSNTEKYVCKSILTHEVCVCVYHLNSNIPNGNIFKRLALHCKIYIRFNFIFKYFNITISKLIEFHDLEGIY